jgi:hypothetical protein
MRIVEIACFACSRKDSRRIGNGFHMTVRRMFSVVTRWLSVLAALGSLFDLEKRIMSMTRYRRRWFVQG